MELNEGQKAALQSIRAGKNIFLTGPAGSGKSTLIQAIVAWARLEKRKCEVTALTGCAALLLGNKAKTLHSWAGIGLGKKDADSLIAYVRKSPYALKRWRAAKLLIIDEISMMTPDLFQKLDAIGKSLRNSSQPWGGIQLVVCGDFFQLPPVSKEAGIAKYAFECQEWNSANLVTHTLTQIERQKDAQFQKLLNEARTGTLSDASAAILQSRRKLPWKELVIKPTLLFSRNADVDAINMDNLAALEKPIHTFSAKTRIDLVDEDGIPYEDIPSGELLERLIQKMDNDSPYNTELEICEGCQVMLLYNKDMDAGLVNGSRGVVKGFRREDGVPIVQFLTGQPICIEAHEWTSNDTPCLKRVQIPLRVAYAVTIHKSQGATLDCALVDIGSSTFETGQAYVALSRVRNLESLYVHNLDVTRIRADPRVVEFYKTLEISEPSQPPAPPPSPESEPIILSEEFPTVHTSWFPILETWKKSLQGQTTLEKVADARKSATIFPAELDVFAALRLPLQDIKVVILGQDPYHEKGQAMGLAFSVQPGTKMPPSLKNIRKELKADLGEDVWVSDTGDLTPWVNQGVLLLNTVLTVEEGKANSHASVMGWETLTKLLLREVVQNTPAIFLAWGKFALQACTLAGVPPDRILTTTHPSPLSASKGFLGSRHFSKANALLPTPISWKL